MAIISTPSRSIQLQYEQLHRDIHPEPWTPAERNDSQWFQMAKPHFFQQRTQVLVGTAYSLVQELRENELYVLI